MSQDAWWLAPGSSAMRCWWLLKASGGQVIGSSASPVRSSSGSGRSAVCTWTHRQASSQVIWAPTPWASVTLAWKRPEESACRSYIGVVDEGLPQRPRRAEIQRPVIELLHRHQPPGQQPLAAGFLHGGGGQRKDPVLRPAGGERGSCATPAQRRGVPADVGGGHQRAQSRPAAAGIRRPAVARSIPPAPGEAQQARRNEGVLRGDGEIGIRRQPVQRMPARRLGQRQLVFAALPAVAPIDHPVGPGGQQRPGVDRARPVRVEGRTGPARNSSPARAPTLAMRAVNPWASSVAIFPFAVVRMASGLNCPGPRGACCRCRRPLPAAARCP